MTARTKRPAAPRLVRVAAALGDVQRSAMLTRLLDGRFRTAAELATVIGVGPAAASRHLRLLHGAHLVQVRTRGRHRYWALAAGDVGHAVEALLQIDEPARTPDRARWTRPAMRPLRHARSCRGHLGGQLGVWCCAAMLERGWLLRDPAGAGFAATPLGRAGLAALGVPARVLEATRTPVALRACLDASERQDHLGGPAAAALLEAFVERDWLRRIDGSRALVATEAGIAGLRETFGETFGEMPAADGEG